MRTSRSFGLEVRHRPRSRSVTSRKQLPRGKDTIGLYVSVLDDFLTRHSDDDALVDSFAWLPQHPLGPE